MKVILHKSFEKQFNKLPSNTKDKVKEVIKRLIDAPNLNSLSDLDIKRIKHKEKVYYRIRIANYRLGFKLENNTIYLIAIMHCKDIHKFFPPK